MYGSTNTVPQKCAININATNKYSSATLLNSSQRNEKSQSRLNLTVPRRAAGFQFIFMAQIG